MSLNHAARVLAGIVPDRKDLLLHAVQHLEEAHFAGEIYKGIFRMLNTYYDVTMDVLPSHIFADSLSKSKTLDTSKALLYEEAFSEIENLQIPDHEFRYSVDALKRERAEQLTGEAITTAFEIFQRGAEVGREHFEGAEDARKYAYSAFAEIDKLDAIEVAPEGDMRHEASEFLEEYEAIKNGEMGQGILTGIKSVDQASGGFGKGELIVAAAFTNAGKASPLWTPVLTPTGWRTIGELSVGDEVMSTSGTHQKVSGVFDRGVMKTYRVTTADGGSVLTAGDHLWEIRLLQDRYFGTKTHRVESTLEIAEHLRKKRRVFLPLPKPMEFDPVELPVDPYTLGALLGDGSFRMNEIRFSVHVDDVGTYSDTKFIPEPYLLGSSHSRLALLQGLMDTDGTIADSGKGAEISLSSEQMVRALREIVFSLGGSAGPVRERSTSGKPAWRFTITYLPEGMNPFRLRRKAERWSLRKRNYDFRRVVSVEAVGEEEVRCIAVSSPDHLYITEDYLVTHNTQFCCQTAWDAAVMQGKNVFFATSETVRTTVRRRIIARHSRLPQFGLEDGLDSTSLKRGTLSPKQEVALKDIVHDLDTNPNYGKLYICQIPRGATLSYLEARMNRQGAMWEVDLAIMDYVALLKSDRKRSSEREEMNEVIKDTKVFATSFNDGAGVPFVTPWQIRRESHTEALRTGSYGLASLSDTAEIEKSADQILTMLRVPENPKEVTLQFLKMRDGDIPNPITLRHDFRNAYLTDEKKTSAFGAAPGSSAFGITGPSPTDLSSFGL